MSKDKSFKIVWHRNYSGNDREKIEKVEQTSTYESHSYTIEKHIVCVHACVLVIYVWKERKINLGYDICVDSTFKKTSTFLLIVNGNIFFIHHKT